MVKYLLDTCVLISVLRGRDSMQEKILEAGIQNCAISELTLAELYAGPYKLMSGDGDGVPDRDRIRAEMEIQSLHALENTFKVLPLEGCAEKFAREHSRLCSLGCVIPDIDLLIGTFALSKGYTLVTGNVRHFERIEGLLIENWYA